MTFDKHTHTNKFSKSSFQSSYSSQDFQSKPNEMNNIFAPFSQNRQNPFHARAEHMHETGSGPIVHITENAQEWIITAYIANIDPAELSVTFSGNTMTLKGQKHEEYKEETTEGVRQERRSAAFTHSVSLPQNADTSAANINVMEGVTTIRLPKIS